MHCPKSGLIFTASYAVAFIFFGMGLTGCATTPSDRRALPLNGITFGTPGTFAPPPAPPAQLFLIPGSSPQDVDLERILKAQEWDTYRRDLSAYRQAQEEQQANDAAQQQADDDAQRQQQQADDDPRQQEQQMLQQAYDDQSMQQQSEE